MIISDKDLRGRLVRELEWEEAETWWKQGQWDRIQNRLLIWPYDSNRLGPCSYELTVGSEYVSLHDPYNPKQVSNGQSILIGPSETVLILTEEFLALPKTLMGIVIPRARMIFEGTAINASRIDPTWYGKLLIGITNHANFPISIQRGETFCTTYFMEVSEVETVLSPQIVPHLGRKRIGRLEYPSARPRVDLQTGEVSWRHLDELVKAWGQPWDIVRGALELTKDEVIRYVDKDLGPNLVEQATSAVIRQAFDRLYRLQGLFIAGTFALLAALIALVSQFLSRVP